MSAASSLVPTGRAAGRALICAAGRAARTANRRSLLLAILLLLRRQLAIRLLRQWLCAIWPLLRWAALLLAVRWLLLRAPIWALLLGWAAVRLLRERGAATAGGRPAVWPWHVPQLLPMLHMPWSVARGGRPLLLLWR